MARYWLDHKRIVDNETGDAVLLVADPDTGEVVDWPWVYGESPPESYQRAEEFAIRVVDLLNEIS